MSNKFKNSKNINFIGCEKQTNNKFNLKKMNEKYGYERQNINKMNIKINKENIISYDLKTLNESNKINVDDGKIIIVDYSDVYNNEEINNITNPMKNKTKNSISLSKSKWDSIKINSW